MGRKHFDSIAAYLAATGRTQESLADELGISYPQMSRIVRGLVMPKPELAIRIAQIAGVSVEAIVRACADAVAS